MSHAGHRIVKCVCGNVLSQCRCILPNKAVETVLICTCAKPKSAAPLDFAADYLSQVEQVFGPAPQKVWVAEADDRYYDEGGQEVIGVFTSRESAMAFADQKFPQPKGEWDWVSFLNGGALREYLDKDSCDVRVSVYPEPLRS